MGRLDAVCFAFLPRNHRKSRTPRPSSPGSNPFYHVHPRLHARHAHVLALAELSPTDAPPPPARWPLLVRRPRPPVRVRACQQLARPRTTNHHPPHHKSTPSPPHHLPPTPPTSTYYHIILHFHRGGICRARRHDISCPDLRVEVCPADCARDNVPAAEAPPPLAFLSASSPSHRPSCDVLPRRDRAGDFALSLMFSPHRHVVVLCRSFWRRTPMPCRCAS